MSQWQRYHQAAAGRFTDLYLTYTFEHSGASPQDLDTLEAELPNLLKGMQLAHVAGHWEAVLDYASVLCRPESGCLGVRGYWAELQAHLSLALEAAQRSGQLTEEAALWQNLSVLTMNQGQIERAREQCQAALERFEQAAEERGTAQAQGLLGTLARLQGDYPQARSEFEAVLEIFERLDDPTNMAITYHQLARLAEAQRDVQNARSYYQADLALEQELENERGIALARWGLGNVAYLQGDLKEAGHHYQAAWEMLNALGDKRNIAGLLGQWANLDRRIGKTVEAEALFWQAVAICRELEDVVTESLALFNLAALYREQGDLEQAVALLERVVEIEEQAGLPDLEMDRRALAQVRDELGK